MAKAKDVSKMSKAELIKLVNSQKPKSVIQATKEAEDSQLGIDEVILYFNVGRKPHTMVKEQMHRFVDEIATAF